MGHSWREMDPAGARAHADRLNRLLRMREALRDIPLGHFTVDELDAVTRVMGLQRGGIVSYDPDDSHYQKLERRLKIIKSENKK